VPLLPRNSHLTLQRRLSVQYCILLKAIVLTASFQMLSNLSLINQLSILRHFNFHIDSIITYCKKGNISKLNELCILSDNSCRETKDILKNTSHNIVLGSINKCTQILGRISKTYLRVSEMQSVVLRKVDMFSEFVFCTFTGSFQRPKFHSTLYHIPEESSPQQHPLSEPRSIK